MKKGRTIAAFLLTAASAIAWIMVEMNKSQIIIDHGINGYRSYVSVTTGLFVVFALAALISAVTGAVAESRRRRQEEEAAGRARPAADAKKRASLSVDGTLDPEEIRQYLLTKGGEEWYRYRGNIRTCIGVMDEMQECLNRLDTLLDMNGAESLRDTQEVLRQVQQHICRNMRKVINHLSAVDVDSPEAEAGIRQRFGKCISDSNEKLDKVNAFLVSLSDFLNTQGEDSSALDMLDIYKGTILESIGEGQTLQAGKEF